MASVARPALAAGERRAYETTRLRLARLRADGGRSLQDVFRSTLEAAARTLAVERVGIWLFDVHVDSTPGQGTTVYVYLPRIAAGQTEGAAATS